MKHWFAKAHAAGMEILPWTVDDEADFAKGLPG